MATPLAYRGNLRNHFRVILPILNIILYVFVTQIHCSVNASTYNSIKILNLVSDVISPLVTYAWYIARRLSSGTLMDNDNSNASTLDHDGGKPTSGLESS